MKSITFDNITLDEVDTLVSYLTAKTRILNININDVVSYIQTHNHTKFYFDTTLTGCEPQNSMYLWLDTGYVDNKKQPIFISCLNNHGTFIGHIVGNPSQLMEGMATFNSINSKKRIEKLGYFNKKYERLKAEDSAIILEPTITPLETEKKMLNEQRAKNEELVRQYWENKKVMRITEEIASNLLINNWNSIFGLDRYIKIIGSRLQNLVDANKEKYYVLNRIKSAICNTGLINTFGEDIYVLYRVNLSYGFYEPYKFISSQTEYINEGFTREQSLLELEPITFFDDENNALVASMADINFNARDWQHIISERRARFPAELDKVSDVSLITQVKQSLEVGLRLQKRDGSFAKPIYSTKTGSIAWVLPFFVNGDFTTTPELVLVIYKVGDYYQLKTILPYDDKVKDKLMDMQIYSKLW